MKKIVLIVLALAAAWQPDLRGQSVTMPKVIVQKAARPIFVSPAVDGDDIRWEVPPGLDDWVAMLPPEVQKNFGNAKIFYGDAGTYILRAWTAKVVGGKAKLSDVAVCKIVIEGKDPTPMPPPPPPPPPQGPVPPADLVLSLRGAVPTAGDKNKAKVYGAVAAELAPVCLNTNYKTADEVLALWKASVGKVLTPSDIFQVRLLSGQWLDAHMPANRTAQLDVATRLAMEDAFLKLAAAIKEATK